MTTRDHAAEIWDLINGTYWVNCQFPAAIYFDPSMSTQRKMSDTNIRADIDEYKEYFAARAESRGTAFIPANNRKPDGCNTLRMLLDTSHGEPALCHFKALNGSYVAGLRGVEADENNPEIYAKQDGDDAADEARYGSVAIRTIMADIARSEVKFAAPVDNRDIVGAFSNPYRGMFFNQAVGAVDND
jgi:hypothetical protein